MPSFLATARSNKLPSQATGNVTAETQILGSDGALLLCPIEGSSTLNNRRFRLSIAGRATSGTTSTVNLRLYLGTSTTIATNGTALFNITTASFASGSHTFAIDVLLKLDTVGNIIEGIYFGQAVNTLIALTAITSTSTGSFSDTSETQAFNLTAIFNSTNASNTLVVDTFELIPE